MLLAIPHYLVLAVLGVAFAVCTLVAGCAILVSGRYPRPLFDFNVAVLRWNWRVGFYAYAALGTDRYPPFTLARTDYPADLEITYPERLSRSRVLVGALLALPHLLVVALVAVDILPYPWLAARDTTAHLLPSSGFSVFNLLVVLAGFFLLVTRRYPAGLFDLLLGLNGWLYRVLAYIALLSQDYPPFRLDAGSEAPGRLSANQTTAP